MRKELVIVLIVLSLLAVGCTTPNTNNPDTNSNGGTNLEKTVQKGSHVFVNYRGTLPDGTEFDSSLKAGRTPLDFNAGAGQMIAGFDEAVIGMKIGDEKTITLPPEKAYGPVREDLIVTIPRSELTQIPESELTVGNVLMGPSGPVTITKVDVNSVTINANHELAGKTLTFWIKVVDIQ